MTSEALLLPCPHCGGEMQFRKALWPSDGCTDAIIHKGASECGLVAFDTGTIDKSVIAVWNTRPPLPAAARARIRAEMAREIAQSYRNAKGSGNATWDGFMDYAAGCCDNLAAAEEAKAAEEPRT